MNKFASGLSVRFFKVMIATGKRQAGKATGSVFNSVRSAPNFSTEPGTMVRKRPAASKPLRSGKDSPSTVV